MLEGESHVAQNAGVLTLADDPGNAAQG